VSAVGNLSSLVGVWLVAGMFLAWGHLPARWRSGVALLCSLSGLAFLVVAMGTEGQRASWTVRSVLFDPHVVAEPTAASASLPYYVLTAACLLLGTTGLALTDRAARALTEHWMATAIGLSLLVTVVRFALEKAAAPRAWTDAIGVTWLVPLVAVFFVLNMRAHGLRFGRLAGSLLVYAFAVRGAVALLMLVATSLRLGSHYDISPLELVRDPLTLQVHEFVPGSLSQLISLAVVPQLVVWPILTLAIGLASAAVFGLAAHVLGTLAPAKP
jgi:hypothetical protein